jgi:transketolase
MRTLEPLDDEILLQSLSTSSLIVIVEDHFQSGGLTSIIAEFIMQKKIVVDVLPITFGARYFKPALLTDILEYESMSATHIMRRIIDYRLRINSQQIQDICYG